MNDSLVPLAQAIGARVKRERLGRGWTLDQLAAAAGVSRRLVINVEQGAANPSVATLLRISDALGIGLPALVETPRPTPVAITRAGQGAALWHGEHGGRALLVAGTDTPDVVELWDWTLAPGDHHRSEAHTAGTRELLQVQAGRLRLDVAGEAVDLKPGDAAAFPGDVAHAYAATGRTAARFTLAVFEPGVGPAGHPATGRPITDPGHGKDPT